MYKYTCRLWINYVCALWFNFSSSTCKFIDEIFSLPTSYRYKFTLNLAMKIVLTDVRDSKFVQNDDASSVPMYTGMCMCSTWFETESNLWIHVLPSYLKLNISRRRGCFIFLTQTEVLRQDFIRCKMLI
jgi:hypothetical protein